MTSDWRPPVKIWSMIQLQWWTLSLETLLSSAHRQTDIHADTHRQIQLINVMELSSTLWVKKIPTFKLAVTLPNLNRFSKFLRCWKAYEICYKIHTTLHILPRHVATRPILRTLDSFFFKLELCKIQILYELRLVGMIVENGLLIELPSLFLYYWLYALLIITT